MLILILINWSGDKARRSLLLGLGKSNGSDRSIGIVGVTTTKNEILKEDIHGRLFSSFCTWRKFNSLGIKGCLPLMIAII